ncbi:poly(U)-specific endoribonuclease [Primorskyibacter sedentarius]|uniref:Poly(U)-specific endoribonuclease n=1 Tax=Primorskyibacter sedentarius TaxID=745311 RepID=A0A4R3IS13_9RHOB|nr:lamin tail domain-containing protein [Primorskyibacter sedentarius]TCS51114.1 poly(U)-specific endoribonuclease [Primorskyibacter sedentarius]
MTSNIYQELWDIDLKNGGCTVSGRDMQGNWVHPDADILVDEQLEATSASDAAPEPLFHFVNPDKLSRLTYTAFIDLLNNYVVNARLSEDHLGDNAIEDQEITRFMDVMLETDVMRRAEAFVRAELVSELSAEALRSEILRMWFELYTNHFNSIAISHASGFEHVMVGEGKLKGNGIGGYHSWIKFYLDEQSGRVDFRGFNYDGNFNRTSKAGASFPYVATVAMSWTQLDIRGQPVGKLNKDLGGFFIGPSPELQMALGTIAFYESVAGRYSSAATGLKNDQKAVMLMNGRFHLVLYRNTTEDQMGGDRIRSFWPKFIAPIESTEADVVVPVGEHAGDQNSGVVRIRRSLVNPEGSDFGREWVEIENTGSVIVDITGWTLRDKSDRAQILQGQIEPQKTRRIVVSRETAAHPQLGNKGGQIVLRDGSDALQACVGYGASGEGVVLHFVDE